MAKLSRKKRKRIAKAKRERELQTEKELSAKLERIQTKLEIYKVLGLPIGAALMCYTVMAVDNPVDQEVYECELSETSI